MKRKVLSMVLAIVMLLGMLPLSAMAVEGDTVNAPGGNIGSDDVNVTINTVLGGGATETTASDGTVTITLTKNIALSADNSINITGDKNYIFDFAGHTITTATIYDVLKLSTTGAVTLKDTGGTGGVQNTGASNNPVVSVASESGLVTINGGTYETAGTGHSLSGDSSVTIDGGTFASGISFRSAPSGTTKTLTVNGGTITGSKGKHNQENRAGIEVGQCVGRVVLNVTDGIITGEAGTADKKGGDGISINQYFDETNKMTLSITGGTITGGAGSDPSHGPGFGLSFDNGNDAVITIGGTAHISGSARTTIHTNGKLLVEGNATIENTGGGSAMEYTGADGRITGGTFIGGLEVGDSWVKNGTMTITGGTFKGRAASSTDKPFFSSSSAVLSNGNGTLTITGGNFTGGAASAIADGNSGISASGNTTITGGTFTGGTASSYFGGGSGIVVLGNTTIEGGTFTGRNGMDWKEGTLSVTGGTFQSNAAEKADGNHNGYSVLCAELLSLKGAIKRAKAFVGGVSTDVSKLGTGTKLLPALEVGVETSTIERKPISLTQSAQIERLGESGFAAEELTNGVSTYTLLTDLKYTTEDSSFSLDFRNQSPCVLDLNGHSVTRADSGRNSDVNGISISNGATVTLKDSAGGGKVVGGIQNRGTLTIEGGTYEAQGSSAGVQCEQNSSLTMKGGTVIGGGGGIYNGHIIRGNSGICMAGGTLSMEGGIVTGGVDTEAGSGMPGIQAAGPIHLKGGTITGGAGVERGGDGISVNQNGTLTIDENCTATVTGGKATQLDPNQGANGGHALSLQNIKAPFTIPNGTYIGGAAEGGQYASGGCAIELPSTVLVTISNGTYKGGDASGGTDSSSGGDAVWLTNDTMKLTINGGTFTGGGGTSAGAGLGCSSGTVKISAGTFDFINLNHNEIDLLLASGSTATWDTAIFDQTQQFKDVVVTVGNAEEAVAPVITTQPQAASGTYGTSAGTLSVAVTPVEGHTYTYQWYLDASPVGGATEATYPLPDTLAAGSHSYSCKVTARRTIGGRTATVDSSTCTVTVGKKPLTVASYTPAGKNYDGKTTANITGVTFTGLIGQETLTATTDYTVSNAKFANADAGNVAVTGTVALVENGSTAKNYSLASGALTGTSAAIAKIAPTITIATNAPNEGMMGGKDVEVTVTVTNPAGATAGFPAANQITIAPGNATLKTALTQTGTTGVYKATYTLNAYAQANTKAKFTVTIPNATTNYTAYTETDKAVEVTILDKNATTTTLTASKPSITYGEPVTLTATVTPGVSGTVQFKEGGTSIGAPVLVKNGTASLVLTSTELRASGYSFIATFTSTSLDHNGSISNECPVTVAKKALTVNDGTLAITRAYDKTTAFAAGNASNSLALTGIENSDAVTVKIDAYGAANDANVGTKTIDLTVSLDGAAKDNYTINGQYSFTKAAITPKSISATIADITSQTYTGLAIELAIIVKDEENVLTADDYTAVYANNMNVSNGAKVTVTPKGNYSGGAVEKTFAITKADAPAPQPGTLSVTNKRAHDYTYDLTQLLTAAQNFGTPITYTITAAAGTSYYDTLTTSANITGSTLTVPVKNVNSAVEGTIGTGITINVSSQNYEDMTATITVASINKTVPTITGVGPYSYTYGDKLSKHTVTGTAKVGEMVIPGSFAWDAPDTVPTVATTTAPWTFTPTDAELYAPAKDNATIAVAKANVTGEPSFTAINTAGKTLADAHIVIGTLSPAGGTLAWDMPTDTVVLVNQSYGWTYTPTDTANYHVAASKLMPYYVYSGGGTVTPPAPKPEPPKTDTATGNTEVSVPVKPVTKGDTSSATVPEKSVSDAIAAAEKEAAKTGGSSSVAITVDAPKGAKTVETTLPSKSLSAVAEGKTEGLKISTPVADLSFDSEALKNIAGVAGKDVKISATQVDTKALTDTQKSQVGDAPVFDFTVSSGDKTISNFNGGTATVSVPYAPKKDENPEFVKVWLLDDTGKLIPIEASYKDGKISFETGHFSRYAIGYLPFTDVKPDWSYESIVYVYQNKLFAGVGENKFAPTDNMNRAMLWTVLYRMAGSPDKTETPANWYADAQKWAIAQNISDGTNPDGNITREQLATILWRYAQSKKQDVSIGEDTNILSYDDFEQMSQYAIPALQWACGAGVITGKSNSVLDPAGNATRAEVATMLQRYAGLSK